MDEILAWVNGVLIIFSLVCFLVIIILTVTDKNYRDPDDW